MKLSRTIYKTITRAGPSSPNIGLENEALTSLLNSAMSLIRQRKPVVDSGNNVQTNFGTKYRDFGGNIPQYPNTVKIASALLPLMKIMMLLANNNKANDLPPIDSSYRIAKLC